MGQSICMADEERDLECERRMLELEKEDFKRRQKSDRLRMEREKTLFEMKWKILEDELCKLAEEKKQWKLQKEFYYRSMKNSEESMKEKNGKEISPDYKQRMIGKVFFRGVRTETALKRRYKELIKIFHPDNMDGDTLTIQEINREYDQLKKAFCR